MTSQTLHAPSARAEWKAGWPLVGASMAGMSLSPLTVYTMGLFILPLEREFGWSRALIASGMTIYSVLAVLLAAYVGTLIDRFGPRRIAIPGIAIFCLAFASLAMANGSKLQWWILWSGVAVGGLVTKTTLWSAAITSRFDVARGLALAVALSGSAISGMAAPLVGEYLIDAYGWRWGYVGISALWFVVIMPLLLLFFYSKSDLERASGRARAAVSKNEPAKENIWQIYKSSVFVKLALASTLGIFTMTAGLVHFVPLLQEHGLGATVAASVASIIGLALLIGRLSTGVVLDRFSAKYVGAAMYGLPALAFASLLVLEGQFVFAICIAVLFGFCSGAQLEIVAYLASRYFGTRRFGAVFGFIIGLISFGAGISPPAAGFIHDRFGSYDIALVAGIPMAIIAGILLFSLGPYPKLAEDQAAQDSE